MTDKKHRDTKPADSAEISAEAVQAAAAENSVSEENSAAANEELAALRQELQTVQAQSKDYLESWQRERADFANYKRRVDRDQQSLSQNIAGDVIKKYLVVQDDLERALKARPSEGDAAAWANGIELIYRKLTNILEAEGVKRIQAEGEMFDPTRHEAISSEDHPELESGRIIEVLQQGYTIQERVLRPALVRVAR